MWKVLIVSISVVSVLRQAPERTVTLLYVELVVTFISAKRWLQHNQMQPNQTKNNTMYLCRCGMQSWCATVSFLWMDKLSDDVLAVVKVQSKTLKCMDTSLPPVCSPCFYLLNTLYCWMYLSCGFHAWQTNNVDKQIVQRYLFKSVLRSVII